MVRPTSLMESKNESAAETVGMESIKAMAEATAASLFMYETDSVRWWWVLAIMPLHLTLNDRKLLTIVSNDFQKRLFLRATVIDARSFNVSVSQQESFEKQSKTLELGTRTNAATLANY